MAQNVVITEKTTTALNFQLLDAGVPANLTGATVTLLLTSRQGTSVSNPTVAVTDATLGKVSYTPANTSELAATGSPYRARWKVTDGTGKIKYFPNGLRDEWEVTKE